MSDRANTAAPAQRRRTVKPKPLNLRAVVLAYLAAKVLADFHTHLFDRWMKDRLGKALLLTSFEDLLTYHYLYAEVLRVSVITPAEWDAMTVRDRAKLVWQELFVNRLPTSEATMGVVTALSKLDLPTSGRYEDVETAYEKLAAKGDFIDRVFELAKISHVFMTNDPLDPDEQPNYLSEDRHDEDPRFRKVLRLDSAIGGKFSDNVPKLQALGYKVTANLNELTLTELRRYLEEWTARLKPAYLAISLPPDFTYPTNGGANVTAIMNRIVLPFAREKKLPVALMIGVRRGTNPALRSAGDSYGRFNVTNLEALAKDFPDLRFYVTLLHRDDQHPLMVTARKFRNIIPFGCWWFVNIPELTGEISAMRLQGLGPTFIPWHSDCRHLAHLVYKREQFMREFAEVMIKRYELLHKARELTEADIHSDLDQFLAFGQPA